MRRSRARKNIVLLSTDSRETKSKQYHYAAAARKLGLAVRRDPDQHTVGVIPCSDALAAEAAWLARSRGIPSADPLAVEIATCKTFAYQFLHSRGFSVLFWHVPLNESDLRVDFDRPIILKPEKGSGSIALHPWAYRIYQSPAHFLRALKKERLLARFIAAQRRPLPHTGRYLMMEYVDSKLYAVASATSQDKLTPYSYSELSAMPDRMQLSWAVLGYRHPDAARVVQMARAFADVGLRRSVIYIQCVEKGGKLHPIDINLRPGTLSDCLVRGMKLPLYEKILAHILGNDQPISHVWPARYVGVKRLNLPLNSGRYEARFPAGAISLISRFHYNRRKPYDLGHVWPMFAVLASSKEECYRRMERVEATSTVKTLSGAELRRMDG